jgi:hypothetical protein
MYRLQSRTALPLKRQNHLMPVGGENKVRGPVNRQTKTRNFAARCFARANFPERHTSSQLSYNDLRASCRGVAQPGSAPALGARYFIPSILSSALVSIVFNKLGNLLLVQKLTPMASTSLVNARFEHGSAPARSLSYRSVRLILICFSNNGSSGRKSKIRSVKNSTNAE